MLRVSLNRHPCPELYTTARIQSSIETRMPTGGGSTPAADPEYSGWFRVGQ
ncbi:hypothetical protein [Hymenobacter fodinae]|uniref:hypothetical protein n=1 Tax=Hymenobacter fodinae TaxID=2510796 RepID=UPI001AEBDC64|nr:hypothetical protein [Hymenobacter fodinae]